MHRISQFYEISASGGQLYPFINAIYRSDIICTHQRCRGDAFECRIPAKYLPELRTLAEHYGITLEIRALPSLLGWLKRYRFRFGIPAGLLLCGGLLFYLSNIAVTIEVRGNTTISDSVILAVLEENGIAEGKWIGSMDMTHCERRLRMSVPGIAWAGIRSSGNRLVVEVTEATPKLPMLNERIPCNIVSQYDAQVTDVLVYSGHLVRLIGDGVAKGELLVSGVYEDEKGHITYHHAIAHITGIYQKEAELTEYFTVSKTEETGRTHVRRFLRLFHLRIPLGSGNHGFSEYHLRESDTPFSFLGQELPFSILQETYTETRTLTQTRDTAETELALNGAIVRYEKNFLQDVEILDREITYSSDENGMSCHIVYTLEGEIGAISDIYIK